MRHQQHGPAFVGDRAQQREDDLARLGVEVPGWLVGEDELRVVDQRPRNRQPLLFATRRTVGSRSAASTRPSRFTSSRPRRSAGPRPFSPCRQEDVLETRQLRQQVERLEDEPDPVATERRQLSLGCPIEPHPAHLHDSAVGPVEAADDIQ